jgi:cell division protein FtsI (penicillin-binding protein 3)
MSSVVARPRTRVQAQKAPRTAAAPVARTRKQAVPSSGVHRAVTSPYRPLTLLVVFVLMAGGIAARLAFWQVMQHGHLSNLAQLERAGLQVQPAARGEIVDAQGSPMAMNVTLDAVYSVGKQLVDPQVTASVLAPALGVPASRLEHTFARYPTGYATLAPQVTDAVSAKIRALRLPGIVLAPQLRRAYPDNQNASQVIGYVNGDNKGLMGVERFYENILSGQAGLASVLKDTAGNDVHLSSAPPVPSQDGGSLRLTIDGPVQSLVEHALQQAVQKHSADGGTIIVMDPTTGYILGMASSPMANPNQYWKDNANFTNQAIQSSYEPGSTFKMVTMAAGLDTHVITPDTAFQDTGQWVVGDRVLHNWNNGGFGWETMTQVLQHSANVGAAFVSSRLGRNRFYDYVHRFGFGTPTGVDISGEVRGSVPLPGDKTWTIVNQFTNAYGQGLTVTPLQLVRAVAAVANGGLMMKPQVVSQITYRGRVIDRPPVPQGRVISPQTAHTLTKMLVESALGGEAQFSLVKGYDIAAKTGTASIAGPYGQYLQNATIASVVGYAPAYSPRFAVLVKIDHPRDTPWGSMAAAPVLHDLFQQLFLYYHVPPSPHALNQ